MPKPSFLSQHGKKGDRDIEMHPLLDWTHKDDVNYDADEYVLALFFFIPAMLFLGIPFFFPNSIVEIVSP